MCHNFSQERGSPIHIKSFAIGILHAGHIFSIMGTGESKKGCLSYCRNKSSCKIPRIFVEYKFISKNLLYQMAESYSVKAANILYELYIFILELLDL